MPAEPLTLGLKPAITMIASSQHTTKSKEPHVGEANRGLGPEELRKCDGQDGRPGHVARNGVIYEQMNLHLSGADLPEDIKKAPHTLDVLEQHPQVGQPAVAPPSRSTNTQGPKIPAIVQRIPFLRRHPHPMTVHFPIVFSISASCFTLLYLIFGWKGFDHAALCALGGNVLFTPVAMVTGFFTWRFNYGSSVTKETVMKVSLPPVLLGVTLWALAWRLETPDILDRAPGDNWLYLLLVMLLFPLAGCIGWFGINLTFPPHKD